MSGFNRIYKMAAFALLCATLTKVQNIEGNPDSSRPKSEETLELLKKELSSLDGKDDPVSIQRVRNLEAYIDAAEANECTFRSFANLRVYIENDSIQTETNRKDIKDLLSLERLKLFRDCRMTLRKKLDRAVDNLTSKQRKMARKITDSVVEANGSDANITEEAVAKGVATFLKQANALNKLGNQRIFMMSWRRYVIEACEAVDEDIYSIAFIYRSLDRETYAKLDKPEQEWELVSRVCDRIDEFARDKGPLAVWRAL